MIWQLMSVINPLLFSSLSLVFKTYILEINSGKFLKLFVSSMTHFIPGLLIGTSTGIILGIFAGGKNILGVIIEKSILAFRPIPPLAWIPFLIVGVGINHLSATYLISLGIFWIGFFQAMSGIKALDPKLYELAKSCDLCKTEIFFKIYLPQVIPSISTAFRATTGQAWMFLIASELFGVDGFGLRIWESSGILAMDVVATYLFTIVFLYQVLDLVLEKVENKAYAWRRY